MDILQALYDSEINFEIATFWDGGFDYKLGDPSNGFKVLGCADTLLQAAESLKEAAIYHFPESKFAKDALKEIP